MTSSHGRWHDRRGPGGAAIGLALLALAAAPGVWTGAAALFAQPVDAWVVLVRHAEKLDGGDPGLTVAGVERAETLARVLSPWSIERVYASQYRRTQDTAAPLAGRFGLEAEVVDAADVGGLAARIREERRGAVAVVGHSNTVPALIRALGVPDAPAIPEDGYDDLFLVRLAADGRAHLLHLKYGAPSPAEAAPRGSDRRDGP